MSEPPRWLATGECDVCTWTQGTKLCSVCGGVFCRAHRVDHEKECWMLLPAGWGQDYQHFRKERARAEQLEEDISRFKTSFRAP